MENWSHRISGPFSKCPLSASTIISHSSQVRKKGSKGPKNTLDRSDLQVGHLCWVSDHSVIGRYRAKLVSHWLTLMRHEISILICPVHNKLGLSCAKLMAKKTRTHNVPHRGEYLGQTALQDRQLYRTGQDLVGLYRTL